MINYKLKKVKDLEFELGSKLDLNKIFNNNVLAEKYVESLGFRFLTSLENHEILNSNLDFDSKFKSMLNNIVLLKDKETKKIIIGIKDLNLKLKSLDSYEYEEIVFLSKDLFNEVFGNILVASNEIFKKTIVRFYKKSLNVYHIPPIKCKPFDLLIKYFDEKSVVLYISDFVSYLYINKEINIINIQEKNLVNDVNKFLSTIKYLFNIEEKLIIINNTNHEIKSIVEFNDFNFNVSYIDKENFVKIYNQLPG